MPHRRVVFDRIEDERICEDSYSVDYDGTSTIADYLTYMRKYYRVAEQAGRGREDACLTALRRVAALGVACMEKKGCSHRRRDGGEAVSCPSPTDRAEVFVAVNDERKYQDEHFSAFYEPFPTVGPTLTLLRWYLTKADQTYQQRGCVLEVMREITAICVRCLEALGCPQRAKD